MFGRRATGRPAQGARGIPAGPPTSLAVEPVVVGAARRRGARGWGAGARSRDRAPAPPSCYFAAVTAGSAEPAVVPPAVRWRSTRRVTRKIPTSTSSPSTAVPMIWM